MTDVALVTGVAGQDGSYLAERLLADGLAVHGLVRPGSAGSPYLPRGAVVHEGDVRDADAMRRLLLDLAPREVYNLAAVSSVARSWAEPELVAQVNGRAVEGLLAAVAELADRGPVAFVQASSAEIFGAPGEAPQSEETAVAPVNPYGEAKAAAHRAVAEWRDRGLFAGSAILFSHESPRRPPSFVSRKITRAVAAIARGEQAELVLGNTDARRDWGWAPDHVDAMVRMARAAEPGDFVVATGEARSVRSFVEAAFARAGVADWSSYVRTDPDLVRPADPVEQVGDASRARRVLGWAPTVGFDELVARLVDADLPNLPR